ncbi:hypothetical protein JAB6_09980 [Janthinobacterium sp. HH104]|nr:hypothetical protein BW37_01356 [Janthinobacterium lividum]OEZ87746.1 hypothetical protein JAB6_09980 [Janthinobacterium sp. HH104]
MLVRENISMVHSACIYAVFCRNLQVSLQSLGPEGATNATIDPLLMTRGRDFASMQPAARSHTG